MRNEPESAKKTLLNICLILWNAVILYTFKGTVLKV